MAKLSLRHIYKVYPNGAKAVNDFNMEIADKEFIVFVGPSGCGKSTTLRMIAGLEEITAGEFYIGNELMNDIEPKDRDIAMVFQNYALYPHMTVYDNMAFGLKLRHVPQAEIHKKVLWAADILKLTEYLDRKPRAMSGGQRQRVALGRAILRNPKVFLLDEPLSNLDAKLRTEMRAEIAKLHNELKTTFIYVTHDQVEAMTLGTRVVVMKLGWVQQIDTPQNLYEYPENKFVAGFIGTPQMNFFEATLKRNKDKVHVKFDYCDNELTVPFADLLKVKPSYLNGEKHVVVGLRCENISLDPEVVSKSKNRVKIKVSHFEELGNETLVYGDMNMHGDGFLESSTRVIVKSYHGALNLKQGDVVEAAYDMRKAHFFDKDSELTILPRVPTENVFDADVKDNVVSFLGVDVKLPPAFNCPNTKGVEFYVPTDAVVLNSKRGVEVEVEKVEEIKGVKLAYLKLKERTFFAIVKKDYEPGSKVLATIDFKSISIKKDNKEIVSALSEHDNFIGGFANLENSKKSALASIKLARQTVKEYEVKVNKELNLELAACGYPEVMRQDYIENHKKALANLKNSRAYELGTGDLTKIGKRKTKDKYDALIKKEFEDFKAKMDSISTSSNVDKRDESKAKAAQQKAQEKIEFAHKLLSDYEAQVLKGQVNNIVKNKKLVDEAKEELKKQLEVLKQERTKALEEVEKTVSDPKQRQEALDKIRLEYDKKIDAAYIKSKVFYISVNGSYVLSNPEINTKIVQALGIGVFSSNYRYEVPHDSYIIHEQETPGAFWGVVKEVLDYGSEKFLRCEVFGKDIYVQTSKDCEPGTKIYLEITLKNIRIFENKFDIRLY